MFYEDYKRGCCLDDLDVGLDWNALIKDIFSYNQVQHRSEQGGAPFSQSLTFENIFFDGSAKCHNIVELSL